MNTESTKKKLLGAFTDFLIITVAIFAAFSLISFFTKEHPNNKPTPPIIEITTKNDSISIQTNLPPDSAATVILSALAQQSGNLINRYIFLIDSLYTANAKLYTLLGQQAALIDSIKKEAEK